MNKRAVLVCVLIVALLMVLVIVLLVDNLDTANGQLVTVRQATALEKRVAALESMAHEAPWWLSDDMKGVVE